MAKKKAIIPLLKKMSKAEISELSKQVEKDIEDIKNKFEPMKYIDSISILTRKKQLICVAYSSVLKVTLTRL